MALVLAGLAIGAAGAVWLTRLMSSLLFHVSPGDPSRWRPARGCYSPSRYWRAICRPAGRRVWTR